MIFQNSEHDDDKAIHDTSSESHPNETKDKNANKKFMVFIFLFQNSFSAPENEFLNFQAFDYSGPNFFFLCQKSKSGKSLALGFNFLVNGIFILGHLVKVRIQSSQS